MLATSPYFSDTFDFRIADPIFEDLTYKYAWALRAQTPYEDGPNIDPSLTLYNPLLNMTGTIENDDVPNERNDLCEKEDASSDEEEDVSSDERQCIGHADDKVAPFSTVASPAVRPSILSVRSPSTPRVGRGVSSSPLSSLEDLPALSSPPERRSKRLKSMPAIQYSTMEDGDDSDEDMPAKRRKPLSAVQDDEETRGRRSSSPPVEAPEKSARKGKGPAKSKGAKRMTARRAATAAKKVKENKKPGKNGLPAKTWHCDVCDISMRDDDKTRERHLYSNAHAESLDAHGLELPEKKSLRCPWCDKEFSNCRPDSLLRHQRSSCKNKPRDSSPPTVERLPSVEPTTDPTHRASTSTSDPSDDSLSSVGPSVISLQSPGPSEDSSPSSP